MGRGSILAKSPIFHDKVRSCEIRKAHIVGSLLGIETSQLRWFGHVTRMLQERLARQVLVATPNGEQPGRPRARCSDYISDLAWSSLGVEPAELSEIAVDRDIFRVLLGLLAPRPSTEEKRI